MAIEEKLESLTSRHAELSAHLADPTTVSDSKRFAAYSKEFSDLEPVVAAWQAHLAILQQLAETDEMLAEAGDDAEMRQMAREERETLKNKLEQSQKHLHLMLLPKDPNDDKNVILEIRAGTGGEEAALFVSDLFRMYGRFAEIKGWRIEMLSSSATDLGGYKELIAMVQGKGAYMGLKYESGVHRVQRIPVTETGGRIHTSAVTVAILPEADEVELHIEDKDLRIDVYRSSGPGGQSVNTTDSAVRITHLPTGLVVICQDEKSQHKNKAKAMKVLQARLLDAQQQAADSQRAEARKGQVGSGDRSERIRTYNFPQSRVTDHRINLTLHKLDQVLQGGLAEVVDALTAHDQASKLAHLGGGD
ncbi:bacterial peptide chain release factor 1 (bRF-1) [Magnetococcus marinus MC-1]|uniref:Peptide chain release factor 1 n=1 Tax=Magnetococcus marinus (strain ATCC BAA-1437 / JCM 17883 / MC-1) TaxID=156889 RepID=RF1_MAGMM|nr:peptide chain release factor 1 [Magnetococcus marinus]A0LDT7.1 RecName: Full=Peptide chain release factor 1; Short=RF-1 [Magnetococcus marinus MC-1]ABK46130.1 bacterial peptide chain release factor 1 (bRF-1) [Magnetococcus marinus MC-1]